VDLVGGPERRGDVVQWAAQRPKPPLVMQGMSLLVGAGWQPVPEQLAILGVQRMEPRRRHLGNVQAADHRLGASEEILIHVLNHVPSSFLLGTGLEPGTLDEGPEPQWPI